MKYFGLFYWGRDRWYKLVGMYVPFTTITFEVHW